jgi:processive 1,2-diacylglycerol beta-glucosyltransferase
MTKVLLLSAGFGDGHRQVAHALRESFRKREVTVEEVDCFQNTNQFMAKFNQWSYERITRHLPMLYGLSYRLTANLSPNHFLWKLLSIFSRKAFVQAVNRFQPDIVLQLFPDHAAESVLPLNGKPYIGVVFTDFSVHSHWFHKNVDTYFVPSGEMSASMQPFLSPKAEVFESGIPIREQFKSTQSAPDLQSNRPYVFFATGGRGLFPDLEQVITTMLNNLPDFDIYVLCGRNEDMYRRIEARANSEPRLHGLSYIENVATWFQNAALAVVKSGGITVSECLAAKCPMIFYRPQPGQEMDNATFLEQLGTGKVVGNDKILEQVLVNEHFFDEMAQMRKACLTLARPDAAEVIVEHVLEQAKFSKSLSMEIGGRMQWHSSPFLFEKVSNHPE